MTYEPVIGLEIHCELATETKLFCGCSTKFGAPPNSQVCPVCMGLPGVLPVVNEKAVEYMLRTALALNCKINTLTVFDRKNYYYPDLPKNYQISQQYLPFAKDGFLEISVNGVKKKIGIGNIHLEEDAGKNIHLEGENPARQSISGGASLVDLNRTGIPLVEIVTNPDMRNLDEVETFMNALRTLLLYAEVSDCRMEQGSLRFEANISVREKSATKPTTEDLAGGNSAGKGKNILPPRVEIKNLNSFKIVMSAVKHEIERQSKQLEKEETVLQQTRLWDEKKQKTYPMRGKEEAQDYRYFPEPDLPLLHVSDEEIENIKNNLPELPEIRKERFIKEYDLTEYDTDILISTKDTADFFEECFKKFNKPKEIANWLIGPVMRHLNERNITITESNINPDYLASLLKLIEEGKINQNTGKNILAEIFKEGKPPEQLVSEKGLTQVTNEDEISAAIDNILKENPDAVNDFKKGKAKAFGFLVGQVMRLTKGKANPQLVNKILKEKLKNQQI